MSNLGQPGGSRKIHKDSACIDRADNNKQEQEHQKQCEEVSSSESDLTHYSIAGKEGSDRENIKRCNNQM